MNKDRVGGAALDFAIINIDMKQLVRFCRDLRCRLYRIVTCDVPGL